MSVEERIISMPAQWAKAAQTNIPTPPIPGIPYRNAELGAEDMESGQSYDKVYDSARYNQMDFLTTGLVQSLEQYGILPWSSLTNYHEFGICLGLNGILYQALKKSGPANGGAQPTSNVEYWKNAIANDKYNVGQYYPFQDDMPREGMKELFGGVVQNISNYPQMIEYLRTPYGQARCVSQVEWDYLHVKPYYTLADGTEIGFEGIGGVNKFVWDEQADTLRVPDLEEMFERASPDVGGVHLDRMRNFAGEVGRDSTCGIVITGSPYTDRLSGPFYASDNNIPPYSMTGSPYAGSRNLGFNPALVVPVGNSFAPRSWGALPCVYMGTPR